MSNVMKLTIKLTSLETSYGEIMSVKDSVEISTDTLPVNLVQKLKSLIREDNIFYVEIIGESGVFDAYVFEK